MAECEYLAVDPAFRGRKTGSLLTHHTRRQFTAHGYRLLTATVTEDNFPLLPYYRSMGWHTLRPREPPGILDPARPTALWRPSEANLVQMWMPLHPTVATAPWPTPYRTRPVITGVLAPPGNA
ncbi:GNAT family N-acetyltransferase [Streptomyces sp. NPDC058000]|uniref:GNAT family N-acetyltransferase n=1 Tax=Streptomyces sp. NPDC058000 TaxID=3346299 RepID=UPI0036EB2FB0